MSLDPDSDASLTTFNVFYDSSGSPPSLLVPSPLQGIAVKFKLVLKTVFIVPPTYSRPYHAPTPATCPDIKLRTVHRGRHSEVNQLIHLLVLKFFKSWVHIPSALYVLYKHKCNIISLNTSFIS